MSSLWSLFSFASLSLASSLGPQASSRSRFFPVHGIFRRTAATRCNALFPRQNARREFAAGLGAVGLGLLNAGWAQPSSAARRLDPVNRPDLLPKGEVTPLIDVTGMLSKSQEKRILQDVQRLEKDIGVKLRILCQTYPETPGLAVQDYWKVDADTVVLVADPQLTGNLLNFNVGDNIDLKVPRNYWGRLSGKFGAKTYWEKEGADSAVVNAVSAIDSCARAADMGVKGACMPGTIKARDSADDIMLFR